VTAFLLINVEQGEAFNVVRNHLKNFKARGVKEAYVVTGTHDVIAKVEAESNDELLKLVVDIQKAQSPQLIRQTQTAVAVDSIWS